MSRHTHHSNCGRYMYAIGYDDMIPGCEGFFIQIYDKEAVSDIDEGIIVNEGYVEGLPKDVFYAKMDLYSQRYNFNNEWVGANAALLTKFN